MYYLYNPNSVVYYYVPSYRIPVYQHTVPQTFVERFPVYSATIPELQKLEGKKIRTTVPNIIGTVTAIVGPYNSANNRVLLKNIISDRTGTPYGNLSYLPEELGGLDDLSGSSGTTPGTTPGTQDCTVTGGKGKQLDAGTASLSVASISYTIYECQIEIVTKIVGIAQQRHTITRTNKSINATLSTSPITRVLYRAWIEGKTLWVEIEQQHKNPITGKWLKTGGAKTKLGSWSSLKI
ncbi:hypothetical protein [Bacillus halotolerans]|nr:hypothetical protein [Bacillus halotolerans]MEC1546388.1 hypothetical protein [Bacillus halotolerans]